MKRKWLFPLLMLVLLFWTGHMVLREQSPAQLAAALKTADLRFVLAGCGLMVLYLGCEAACTHLILRTLGSPVPYRRCLGYSCVGFYFSTVTPSSTGGQPMQVYSMTRDGVPGAHGALDMLLISICYQIASALFALAAWIFFPGVVDGFGSWLTVLLIFGFSATFALTVLMTLFLVQPAWCSRLAGGCISLLVWLRLCKDPAPLRERLEEQIAQYSQGGQVLRAKPTLFPRLLALNLLQICSLYLVPWTIYHALGLSGHGAAELVALQALMSVAVGLLPLPGAAGAAEAAFLHAFAAFFGGLVTPAMVLSRGISCYGTLVVTGLVTLVLHLRRRRRRTLEERRFQVLDPYQKVSRRRRAA